VLTETQIKQLTPGDRILVECEVRSKAGDANTALCDDGDVAVSLFWGGGIDHVFARSKSIHAILPRPISVGDKVRYVNGGTVYEVISEPRRGNAVGSEQVALWSDGTGIASAYVTALVRI